MRYLKILAITALTIAALGACTTDKKDNPAADREAESRRGTYESLVDAQPAHTMGYSPSRDTINFWIDTWGEKNKLSYVYLVNANGEAIGYYVLKGLPVSYCAALTPTWDWTDVPGDEDDIGQQVPAPGVDGVYYSGGQCNSFYGRDATTGAYIEYTAGLGINVLLYDQPLPAFNGATALGPTELK